MSHGEEPDANAVAIRSWSCGHASNSYLTCAPFSACHFANASSENFAAPGGDGSGGSGAKTFNAAASARAAVVMNLGRAVAAPVAAVARKRRRRESWMVIVSLPSSSPVVGLRWGELQGTSG